MKRKVDKNYNSLVMEMFGIKPIAFNPLLAKLTKSVLAGLFLSQLLYWWRKGSKEGYVFKTIRDAQQETQMVRSEQDRAIRILKEMGILEVEHKGIPRKRHFKVNEEKLISLLEEIAEKRKTEPAFQFAYFDNSDCPF